MELELENNELSGGVAERKEIAKINQETVEVSNSKKGKQQDLNDEKQQQQQSQWQTQRRRHAKN